MLFDEEPRDGGDNEDGAE